MRGNWALTGIFVLLFIYMLDWASGFLIPVTASFLGFLVALPLERRLSRRGVPSSLTAAVVCLGFFALIAFITLSLAGPLAQLIDTLPETVRRMKFEISQLGSGSIDKLREAAEAAKDVADTAVGDSEPALEVKIQEGHTWISNAVTTAPAFGGQIVMTLVLMFFLISSGSTFLHKLVTLLPNLSDKKRAVQLVDALTTRLGNYLGSITIINIFLGIAIAIALALLGVPDPVMFGFIAFALNYIPFIGAIAGASLAALVGFSDTGSLFSSAVVFAVYMSLTSIEGQFVTPYVISGRLQLNPTVVFISVAFFAWIWSVIGMVVAVPLLITAKLIFDHFESTRAIGVFLGGDEREQAEVAG